MNATASQSQPRAAGLPSSMAVLRALRWISRAEGLLAELQRDPLGDPYVQAVRDALYEQLQVERRHLHELLQARVQSSSENR